MSSSTAGLRLKKELLRERLQAKFFSADNRDPVILILGLGVFGGGAGVARFLAGLGYSLVVTDLKSKKELEHSLATLKKYKRIRYVLGKHTMQDIRRADLIVKNPAVPNTSPYLKEAKKRGIPVTNDAELFLSMIPRDKVIGVTGTKGKTTTTLLIQHLLGRRAVAAGVPGVSFFDVLHGPLPQYIVAEFSSFDLELVKDGLPKAVITSLFPDHLNRYPSFTAYAKTKMHIFKLHDRESVAFVWRSRDILRLMPKGFVGKRFVISEKDLPRWHTAASWRVAQPSIALAVKVARVLGTPDNIMHKRLASFKAPPSRLEIIRETNKTVFIDDTTSTNPGAAAFSLAAVARKWRKITIITGGESKSFPQKDIEAYAKALRKFHPHIILFPGSFSKKLERYIQPEHRASTMHEAVTHAAHREGAVVLLPAAASFNMFRNEFDRSAQFQKEVKKLRT